MKMVTGGSCALLLALTTHGHALKAASSCESLSSLALPNTSITLAKTVAAGAFTLPETGPAVPQFSQLPTFCRVAATLTPSSDSDIKIEVWLPAQAWNGKFQAVGNGGWAGTISYGALASALQEGYATASTDTGHVGGNASFAIGHPEKVVDFAYRAVHEMAVKSKAIIAAFYDRAPRFSYWTGCSTGGRQALMEAQRYPDDFDGIIAGAPANNQTQLCAWRIAVEARTLQDPASVVPVAKLALVNRAVLAACDALDGVTDRLLTDPHQCHFDPATILCRGVDRDDCLTARQVEAVKMGYAPATRRTGELIYPGLVPGGEMGWAMLTGAKPEPGGIDVGIPGVGLAHVRPGSRHLAGREESGLHRRRESGSFGLSGSWWETSHLPRLERRRLGWGDLAAEQRQLLLERVGEDGAEARGLAETVHGARYGSLRGWAKALTR